MMAEEAKYKELLLICMTTISIVSGTTTLTSSVTGDSAAGTNVVLTCTVPSGVALTSISAGGIGLSDCITDVCSPAVANSGRYTFSMSGTSIAISISNLDRLFDAGMFECSYNGGAETDTLSLTIVTVSSGATLTEPAVCDLTTASATFTCETDDCVYPTASGYTFTWLSVIGGTEAAYPTTGSNAPVTASANGCSNSEMKLTSTLTIPQGDTIGAASSTATFKCSFQQSSFTPVTATGTKPCTPARLPPSPNTTVPSSPTSTTSETRITTATKEPPPEPCSLPCQIGAGVGGALLIISLIIVVTCLCRSKRRKKTADLEQDAHKVHAS